jgi:NAD(P)-dependent dehydrogenase (short-subunit alcohol dehydrogenase family)
MATPFKNKVVIVTGASRGIGQLLTTLFAEAGARVVFGARTQAPLKAQEAELKAKGHDVVAVAADVGKHEDCKRLIETAAQRWGTVDILINNAGLSGVQKPIHELPYEEFDEVIKANQYSVYSCTHFAAPYMIKQKSGVIINVSSTAGLRAAPRRTPYVSSKMGLVGITRTTAHDLGPYNIRANAVSPGAVEGVRLGEVFARASKATGVPIEKVEENMRKTSPMRAFVTDQDICDTILFLCSPQARHITGQDIPVNAGTTMW